MGKNQGPLQKTLNLWAIILIVWSVYRAYFKTDLPIWFDEFIAKPLVFILPVYYYISKIEKKNFFSDINLKFVNIRRDIIYGFVVGIVFFISGAAGFLLKSKTLDSFFNQLPSFNSLLFIVVISLATSVSEEILSRGFVLKRLYNESKNVISASFFASVLFFFLHVPILFTGDKIVGSLLLRVMLTDLVLSLAVSFIYLERKNLWLPILIHTFYSISLYLFR